MHNGERWVNPQRESSDNTKPGSDLGSFDHWHTIADLQQSVLDDVQIFENHPLVPSHILSLGFIYDVKTGQLSRVSA